MNTQSKPYLLFLTEDEIEQCTFFLAVLQFTKGAIEEHDSRSKKRLLNRLNQGVSIFEKIAFLGDDFQRLSKGFQHHYTRQLFLRALADASIHYFDANTDKLPSNTSIAQLLEWYEQAIHPKPSRTFTNEDREQMLQVMLGAQ